MSPKISIALDDPNILSWLGISEDTPKNVLSEVTYFTCLKILSETLGKLSIKMYQYQDQTVSQQDVLKKIFLISSNGVFNSLKQELDNLYENNDILT